MTISVRCLPVVLIFAGYAVAQPSPDSSSSSPELYMVSVVEFATPGPKDDGIYMAKASKDGSSLVTITERGNKKYVGYRGWLSRDFENIPSVNEQPNISITPDGSRWAFVGFRKKKNYLYVDGVKVGEYSSFPNYVIFSKGGHHYFVSAQKKYGTIVAIIDGKEYRHDNISAPIPEHFSPDGKRYAYGAREGNKKLILIDGKKGKKYEQTGMGPLFSYDGKQMAYTGYRKGNTYVVINEKEYGKYTMVDDFVFSPVDSQFAYVAVRDYEMLLVLNHEVISTHYNIWDPTFSPDASRFAYLARDKKGGPLYTVIDGVSGPAYPDVSSVHFSPNNERTAYVIYNSLELSDTSRTVMIDGQLFGPYPDIENASLMFSPDSKHFAYVALLDTSRIAIVTDGILGREYEDCYLVGFGKDDSIPTYRAKIGDNKWAVIRNGVIGPEFDVVYNCVFSEDRQHLAYCGNKGDKIYMVVDGQIAPGYEHVMPLVPAFDSGNNISYFAQHDEQSILKITISPK